MRPLIFLTITSGADLRNASVVSRVIIDRPPSFRGPVVFRPEESASAPDNKQIRLPRCGIGMTGASPGCEKSRGTQHSNGQSLTIIPRQLCHGI